MSTSNSSDFNATRDEIIKTALRNLGVIRGTQTPNAQLITDGAFALNAVVKHLQARGLHVWTTSEATLFVQPGQVKYAISSSSTDNVASSFTSTAMAADAVSGASSITVDSITGISDGDYIGIVVDDGTVHWTTVNGSPSGSTITLTDVLDDSTSEDNKVYAYTTKIVRPLKIVSARWFEASSSIESPIISMIARLDYRRLPNKSQAGSVTQMFYDPQLTTGQAYLWHVPSVFEGYVNFTWHRPIEDFDAAGDNPDLPPEWIRTLTWLLSMEMGPQFDVPADRWQIVTSMATQSLDDMEGWDREEESLDFQPDMGWN